ncbi:MAG: putative toxin-antitoxin system toxin component, PIN family [Deferrisomatales bacterium]
MRVVIDTNVWISGLLWTGAPWKVLRLVEEHRIEPCATPAIIEELFGVLSRPKFQARTHRLGLSLADIREHVIELVSLFEDAEGELSPAVMVSADPDDEVFLRCALASNAQCVVSGDRHLLILNQHRGIPIFSAQDFLRLHFPDVNT